MPAIVVQRNWAQPPCGPFFHDMEFKWNFCLRMAPSAVVAPKLLKETKLFRRVNLLLVTYLSAGFEIAFAITLVILGARILAFAPKPLSYGSIALGLATCGSAVLLLIGIYKSMLPLVLQNLVVLATDLVFFAALFLLAVIALSELNASLNTIVSEGYKRTIALLIVYCEKAVLVASISAAIVVIIFVVVLRIFVVLEGARKSAKNSLMATIAAPPVCQAVGSPWSYPVYNYDDQPSNSEASGNPVVQTNSAS